MSRRTPSTSYAFTAPKRIMRKAQLLSILAICSFITFTLILIKHKNDHIPHAPSAVPIDPALLDPTKPLPPSTADTHPIFELINKAHDEDAKVRERQSATLSAAVAEYRRRYKIPPPPNFDKWYEFAKSKGVQLIDEYDTIYHSLLPFWALKPSVIRGRAKEALGFDNALMGLTVRDGQVISAAGGGEWQQTSTTGMVKDFVKHLPDMDLPFNVHDEPRVIVPHDDLSRLVAVAKDKSMPVAFTNPSPKNTWSPRPSDVDDGTKHYEVQTTRFNKFAHQPTWTNSRISCSPDSPSRALDENDMHDDNKSFTFSSLGFISNKTAFSDICLSPSLRNRFGFFNRPNAYNIVHDLFPIFSQSKISSYQDILYPSPWYWSDKVAYKESDDYDWEKKEDKMYWRGSTTGGFSRDGGWRRQHRQLFVEKINDLNPAKILQNQSSSATAADWREKEVPRPQYADLFDVKFSHIGQCDPGDCDAQKEYFEVVKPAKQHDAWQYKYLLDIDGNAFSGRFYAFLKSKSLVYKMALFREWHEEWLRPWVHYIPLSSRGEEYVEAVRYFHEEAMGKVQGVRIANQGREWAGKVLRNEDFEVWFFRLLLEYGRLIDDNRETIGFGVS
ncbi:glycosyltransferase family 90 [Physcia stellaris]|nr:glycosyltransferase family 90 [Physcia stellaris]